MKTFLIAAILLFSVGWSRPASTLAAGDPAQGRELFTKLRCDTCHSVAGSPTRKTHPLPDLTEQPPNAVATLIIERTVAPPGAMFDEMVMASATEQMSDHDLAHLVAYLRHPRWTR
ncbi:MAG: c-type cytochrome [Thermoanaerobaculia bacterium]